MIQPANTLVALVPRLRHHSTAVCAASRWLGDAQLDPRSISSWLSGRRRVVVMVMTVRFAIVITPLQSVSISSAGSASSTCSHISPRAKA